MTVYSLSNVASLVLCAATLVWGSETTLYPQQSLRRTTGTTTAVGSVTKLRLINADTNLPIAAYDPLPAVSRIDLNTLPTPNLSIEALTSGGTVGSVSWRFESIARTENAAPWAMCFNNGADIYACQRLVAGFNSSITVTPFTLSSGRGTRGTPVSIRLSLYRGSVAAPTQAPAVAPTKAPIMDPTRSPVAAPTKALVPPPTQAPAVLPTKAPTTPSTCTTTISEYINSMTLSNRTLTWNGMTPEDKALGALVNLSLSPCSAVDRFRLLQKYALLTLYNQGKPVTNAWSFPDPLIDAPDWIIANDECTWFGVACAAPVQIGGATNASVQMAVTGLNLSLSTTGSFPDDLGLLTSMLSFNVDRLFGTFPTSYSRWSNLQSFDLWGSAVPGTMPSEIQVWTNLEYLRMGSFGWAPNVTIPSYFANWTKLKYVKFESHSFVGTFPSLMGRWTDIEYFYMGAISRLSGSLPSELRSWTNIQTFSLQGHGLTGPFPSFIEAWSNLKNLDLDNNKLTGSIPESLWNMTTINSLSLQFNNLVGSVPPRFCANAWVGSRKIELDCGKVTCRCCVVCS